ncbi:hypothetical protein TIFTF001_012968 [Ficus carica]|uniref:Uncharacterized protein n=1 Tax=Ficus carica TaxID=3494 RepID=A0AA88D5K6_FICCA|nr:hypothetical protein TIFTF001_012968 [Ficus carica]
MASGGEFKYEKLRTIFEDIAILEKEAITMVERSKLLENLSSENLKAAALKMELRSGCERFFQKIEEKHTPVQIISSSWCGELIRFVFSSSCPEINVHSNELPYDEVSVTTGYIERKVESALDKLKLFREEIGKISETKHMAVFIGSKMPDLLCLLEADIGILISPSPRLTGMAKHFGVSLVPLLTVLFKKDWPESLRQRKQKSDVIYTVSSWTEIQVFFMGR